MSQFPNDPTRPVRLEKAEAWRARGENPYPYSFDRSHTADALQTKYADLADDTLTEDNVTIAGRIVAMRNSGMFIVLDDGSNRIQVFSHKSVLSEAELEKLKLLDIGDWLGVKGVVRRTKRGELTVNTEALTILCKALRALPEKYHGLSDIETRYRQRYLDLITNEGSRTTLRQRSMAMQNIRHFLSEKGFLEVETPMLHTIAGGAVAKPFITHHNALDLEMFMRIAPELHLKRLIIGGLSDKVFEINRCFRNEGLSPKHNPEFTTLELYQAFADYHDMMDLAEGIVQFICQKMHGHLKVNYGETEISLEGPWPRRSMTDLVQEKTGVDFLALDVQEAQEAAKKLGLEIDAKMPWGKVVESVFAEHVEPTLIQPIHVMDLPFDISPLAKVHQKDPRLVERFETYVNGWEIADAFSELNDPMDQLNRFKAQMAAKDAGADEAHPMDEDFIVALEHGMPPTGGLGIGLDRLMMILTDAKSIRDVIAFPTMKPIVKD